MLGSPSTVNVMASPDTLQPAGVTNAHHRPERICDRLGRGRSDDFRPDRQVSSEP